MGEHEGCAQPSVLLPNGLLPNEAASVIRVLDAERWSKAEERTADLIACIQPNQPSEERRNAVADYVQRLITKCFPCQVFTFGSVPLKTYLPDGDIDLTAFSKIQNIKETWANQVRDTLESEEKDENAEFRVKEVQYIQAEVKLIKCLVEDIVVDISFDQLGGLCTLCFLEEVDHLINQNHLFKRSIILIKAWCYYESRILGAHHGLISTYALETLVLYIFHVFNNSFAGPLEVLYRFLEFFSKFDWDNFCVSLWGPVLINSLPDVTAEPPRKDSRELLFSKLFLDACSSVYAVFPGGQDNQGQVQPFVSKYFNVIDPLRINNNLGRSVSKGSFYRIRSAFAFGAKRLARLLDCPKEELYFEVNHFFMNAWDRHGSDNRPDAPRNDLPRLRLSTNPDHLHKPENLENNSSSKIIKENHSSLDTKFEMNHVTHSVSSQYGNNPLESTFRNSDVSTVSCNHNQKSYGNLNSSRISNQIIQELSVDQSGHVDKGQRSIKPGHLVNDVPGRYLFVRTRSSPELTDTYSDTSSRGRQSGKSQISAVGLDAIRKNLGSEIFASQNTKSSVDVPSSARRIPSHQSLDADAESNGASNRYHDDSRLVVVSEEPASAVGTQWMLQEEQDLVNMMASSMVPGFNGQVHMPMNLASPHLPLPLSQSIIGSMGYAQSNFPGMLPANFPLIEHPWGSNEQFSPGVVPSTTTHYFPGIRLASHPEDLIDIGSERYGSVELSPEDDDNDFWHNHDGGSTSGVELDNGSLEVIHSDDQHPSTSAGINPSFWTGVSGSSSRDQMKFTRENRGSMRDDRLDGSQYPDNRGREVYLDDRTVSPRIFPAVRTNSSRSKTSSENSWDGSSSKVSKAMKEKRGRKAVPSIVSSSVYGKGKTVPESLSNHGDDYDRDWNLSSIMSNELAERSTGPQAVVPLNVPRHHIPSIEPAQTSVSDSMIPVAPMLLGPGSRQRAMDNSGVPLTFYPTGPPVPFFTMLPVYNFPTETGSSDTSSHFRGEEGLDNSDSGQNFDSPDGLDQSELLNILSSMRRGASVEAPEQHKSDILNSDFASHWQNLQYGRFCQNPPYHGPLVYPSPVSVPPMYLHGRFPWEGPGRPLSTNMNMFTQSTSYGPRLVPVAPLQSVSNRPFGVYQRYVDEMPRYCSGTGTYLPNPVSARDRHPWGSRRGNYSYERSDHQGDRSDREGNWNTNSKTRTTGRNHSRSQAERSSSRLDRFAASESRADRPWTSYRPESPHSYQSQNGPLCSNSTQSGSANVAYDMCPLQAINSNGVSSNGPTVMMLYPYDHNASYGLPAEQLEFGSLGPVDFGMNEVSHLSEGSRSSGAFEEQSFHNSSVQWSSPDQPSSPLSQRRL